MNKNRYYKWLSKQTILTNNLSKAFENYTFNKTLGNKKRLEKEISIYKEFHNKGFYFDTR